MARTGCIACEPETVVVEASDQSPVRDMMTTMYTKCKKSDNPVSIVVRFGLTSPLYREDRVSFSLSIQS